MSRFDRLKNADPNPNLEKNENPDPIFDKKKMQIRI